MSEEAVGHPGGLAPQARLELYWQHLEPRSHVVPEPGASGPALRAGVTEVLTGMQNCCLRVPDSNLDADVSHQGTISGLVFLALG